MNRNERLKRNVLEINLDFDQGTSVRIEDEIAAKLLARMDIDFVTQVEGIQSCPGNSRKLFVWLKDSIDISKFCREDSIKVTNGVKTGLIKPMDKSEVSVLVKGLNFNTPDTLVLEYLGRHGKIMSNKVIYETIKEGPTKGIKNGDRKYLIDFSKGLNLGSYHIIDGAKVLISYPGQIRTCGRCHKNARDCPGGGLARQCELKNGDRVRLDEHMKGHWETIGFTPSNFRLDIDNDNKEKTSDAEIKTNRVFTPPSKNIKELVKQVSYNGVIIKNLPEKIPDTEIRLFLETKGLEPEMKSVIVKRNKKNTTVEIDDIDDTKSKELINQIHEKVFFNQKIYCRGMRNLESPVKEGTNLDQNTAEAKEPSPLKVIPGLTEKDAKKAKQKANKKKKEELKKLEVNQSKDLSKEDFLKDDVELKDFQFDKVEEDISDTDSDSNDGYETPTNTEGFFTFSPFQMDEKKETQISSPSKLKSIFAKQIQKEELWRSAIKNQNQLSKKRKDLTPEKEAEDRKTRMKIPAGWKGGKQL